MKTTSGIVTALVAATLLLSACSSDDTAQAPSSVGGSATDAPTGVASASSEPTSSPESAPASDPTAAGGDVGSLDEASATWFSGMCEGMAPLLTGLQEAMQQPDPAAVTSSIEEIGASMVATSQTLATLPPPTFEGGAEYAAAFVAAYAEAGAKFQEAAPLFAAGDPAAFSTVSEAMSSSEFADLGSPSLDPGVIDGLRALPACQPIFQAS